MDKTIILAKLESLKRCIERIETKAPEDLHVLERDWDLQDIIVLNLERAVQTSVDLACHIVAELDDPPPKTMAGSFDTLQRAGVISAETAEKMKKSVGFRNIAVHQYQTLDWEIVFFVVTRHLDDFRLYAKELVTWISNSNNSIT